MDKKDIVKATAQACLEAVNLWLENEGEIVDATTKEPIPNAELTLKTPKKPLLDYVLEELNKKGIKVSL